MFFENTDIKLKTKNKVSEKFANVWKLNNRLLNSP